VVRQASACALFARFQHLSHECYRRRRLHVVPSPSHFMTSWWWEGSVAKFDFWAKSKNRVSGIQWLTDSQTLEKATLRQNPKNSCGLALVVCGAHQKVGSRTHWLRITDSRVRHCFIPDAVVGEAFRYTARGTAALERLAEDTSGELVYTFTTPWQTARLGSPSRQWNSWRSWPPWCSCRGSTWCGMGAVWRRIVVCAARSRRRRVNRAGRGMMPGQSCLAGVGRGS